MKLITGKSLYHFKGKSETVKGINYADLQGHLIPTMQTLLLC